MSNVKGKLEADEREGMVALVASVATEIVISSEKYQSLMATLAQHIVQNHGYTPLEAVTEIASIVRDSFAESGAQAVGAAQDLVQEKSGASQPQAS